MECGEGGIGAGGGGRRCTGPGHPYEREASNKMLVLAHGYDGDSIKSRSWSQS